MRPYRNNVRLRFRTSQLHDGPLGVSSGHGARYPDSGDLEARTSVSLAPDPRELQWLFGALGQTPLMEPPSGPLARPLETGLGNLWSDQVAWQVP